MPRTTAPEAMEMCIRDRFHTEVLAASFKNSRQVISLCEYGIGATTISPDVLELLIKNDSVTAALNTFRRDFEKLCGKGKTMLDCG